MSGSKDKNINNVQRKVQEKKVQEFFSEYADTYYAENYEKNFETVQTYAYSVRSKHILRMLRNRGGKILNIGCGPGVMTKELLERGYEVWSVDISPQMVEQAKKRIPTSKYKDKAHFDVGSIEELVFKDSFFDAVICAGVLPYVENDIAAMKELDRILKLQGVALICVPAKRNSYVLFRTIIMKIAGRLIKHNTTKLRKKILSKEFRYKRYSIRDLDKLASFTGLRKTDFAFYHFIFFPFDVLFKKLSLKIAKKLEKLLFHSKTIGWLGKGYVVKLQKGELQ